MKRLFPALLLLTAGCSALRVGAPLLPASSAVAPEPPLEVAWRVDAGGAFGRAPAISTTRGALITTRRGEVILLDADGRRRGSVSVGASVDGPAALVGGRTLVVGVDGGRYGLVALDLVQGGNRWRALRDVEVEAGVVEAGAVVVAPALDGVVYGVDLESGEVRWQTAAVPHATHRAPPVALDEETVLVANTHGTLTAYGVSDGRVGWTVEVGAPVEEAPAMVSGILIVPTTRGRLVALDARTGQERWSLATGSDFDRYYTPAIAGDVAIVGSSAGALVAVSTGDGSVLWRHERDGHVASAPLIADGFVYAGTLDERLIVLDARTGAVMGSYELDGRAKSTPAAVAGLVLVPAEPGHVWAFRSAAITRGGTP